jgi:hypothetical protein
MVSCDCCGKRVDERSMDSITGQNGKTYFVCQSCRGYYDDQELLDKCEEQASLELQTHARALPKPGVPRTRS